MTYLDVLEAREQLMHDVDAIIDGYYDHDFNDEVVRDICAAVITRFPLVNGELTVNND